MKYLQFIDLPSANLTREEHDYLDQQARHESWCKKNKGRAGRNIHVTEAIEIFKEDLPAMCFDHIKANDNPSHWKGLLEKISDNFDKLDVVGAKNYPIEDLIRRFNVEEQREKFRCPFHEDSSPSMTTHKTRNIFKCWSCNAGGDTIDFVMRITNCNFVEAVKYLT